MNEDMQKIFEQIKGVIAAFGMFPQKGQGDCWSVWRSRLDGAYPFSHISY